MKSCKSISAQFSAYLDGAPLQEDGRTGPTNRPGF